jgi:hypothetical protein
VTRLEFLAIIYFLKALCEEKSYAKMEEVIDKIIAEAESSKS